MKTVNLRKISASSVIQTSNSPTDVQRETPEFKTHSNSIPNL